MDLLGVCEDGGAGLHDGVLVFEHVLEGVLLDGCLDAPAEDAPDGFVEV